MSGAIWWLSNQRTIVPISAMPTAPQANRVPIASAALWPPAFWKKPSQ